MHVTEFIRDRVHVFTEKYWPHHERNPNAINILKDQHRGFDKLCRQIEMKLLKNEVVEAGRLIEILKQNFTIHSALEEKFFYPAAHRFKPGLVDQSLEEHRLIKFELKSLPSSTKSDQSPLIILAKVRVLSDLIKKHVQDEESVLLPTCRHELSPEILNQLGAKMEREESVMSGTLRSKDFMTPKKRASSRTKSKGQAAAHKH